MSMGAAVIYTPAFEDGEFRKNRLHYLIPNRDGKTVAYTYIRKNACSAFKAYLRQFARENGLPGMETFRLTHPGDADVAIFVYRDPFARFVSAFANKFVEKRGHVDIFENYSAMTGKSPDAATFADFTAYAGYDFEDLDPHMWPQKASLAVARYDHAIPMDELAQRMAPILPSIEPHFRVRANASRTGEPSRDNLTNVPASELAGVALSPANFLTCKEQILDRYAVDVRMIEDITG